jgi:hypothetical protein
MTDYREIIIKVVNENNGIKGVDLSLRVMALINPVKFDKDEYFQSLSKAIEDGEILELEFTVPKVDYKVKSIFFPKGTIFESWNQISNWESK